MSQEMRLQLTEDGSKLVILHARETVLSKNEVIKLLNLDLTSDIKSVIVDILNDPNIQFNNYEGEALLKVVTELQKIINKL